MIRSPLHGTAPTLSGIADHLAALRDVPVAIISDNLDRLPGPVGLRPFHRSGALLGIALTVRTRAGDNLVIHEALEMLKTGDVLVVDGGGDESRALVGEIMKAIAESKGCAGFVIDGAIRDAAAFRASDRGQRYRAGRDRRRRRRRRGRLSSGQDAESAHLDPRPDRAGRGDDAVDPRGDISRRLWR